MLIDGAELIDRDDMVCLSQRTNGYFEPESLAVWRKHCQGETIDIGAYTGLYAIIAAQLGAESYALEPNPAVYARLCDNVAMNSVDVNTIQSAAGAADTTCTMNTKGRPRLTSAGYVTEGGSIPMVRIDSMALDNVTAIKIDAEGYELEVLRGGAGTIAKCMPLIIAEVLTEQAAAELDNYLLPMGYTATPADERNRIYAKASA